MNDKVRVAGRRLWRKLPWTLRSVVARSASTLGLEPEPLAPPRRAAIDDIRSGPVIVSGFFRDFRGISQAARLMSAGLRAAGLAVVEHDVTYLTDRSVSREPITKPGGGVWIIACNPVEAIAVMDQHRELSQAPLYRIGAWVWELPRAPATWLRVSGLFHEIWTPSRFCADAFAGSQAPVWVMPYPIPLTSLTVKAVPAPQPVRFAAFADLRSGEARKNPAAAVHAYLKAFSGQNEAKLVVKLTSPETNPAAVSAIADLISGRNDIELITKLLSPEKMAALYARTAVVLSPHRSEGFGLTLAEAMAAGKAVAATGWSGNREFMTDEAESQFIPYRLVPVDDPSGLYSDAEWAEPDIDAAADIIGRLARQPDLRHALQAANRAAIERVNRQWTPQALAGRVFLRFARPASRRCAG